MEKNTYSINGNEFSLINFKEVFGHDDSLPYEGELCLNGTSFMQCWNDGFGGLTEFNILNKELYQQALDIIKDETIYVEPYSFDVDLYFIADHLAYNEYMKKFSKEFI